MSMLNRETQMAPKSGSWPETLVPGTRVPMPVTLEQAKTLVKYNKFVVSAIEGINAAILLSRLLEKDLGQSSINFKLLEKDAALIALPQRQHTSTDKSVIIKPFDVIEWWLV
jgi:hypothetical protein